MIFCSSNRSPWTATLPWLALRAIPCCLAGVVGFGAATGCRSAPGAIFQEGDPELVWPPSGEVRIAYIGSLSSSVDLKPSVSLLRRIGRWIWGGPTPVELGGPYGLAVDGRDRLYVTDPEAARVSRFDLVERTWEVLRDAGGGESFRNPVGVAVGPGDRVAVADAELGRVVLIGAGGEVERFWGRDAGLVRPTGVAFGPATGRLYAVDVATHQVRVFEPDGTPGPVIGGRGSEPGEFNYPTNIACDSEERLYVADTLNFRVQVLDPSGRPVRVFGQSGDGPGDFAQPRGIALDRDGHVYVVDSGFENVQIFGPEGAVLLSFGEEGHGPGQFWLPRAVSIDHRDRVWVSDSYNHRVQVFRYTGGAR